MSAIKYFYATIIDPNKGLNGPPKSDLKGPNINCSPLLVIRKDSNEFLLLTPPVKTRYGQHKLVR